MKIAVIGASGKSGGLVVDRLYALKHEVIAISRDPARLAGLQGRAEIRVADLQIQSTVTAALAGTQRVINLAHARFTQNLLRGLPDGCAGVVLTGSVRKYTRLEDTAADAVRTAEAAFLAYRDAGGVGVMLHPSMIYGAPGDRNVGRILRLIRRWPKVLPLVLPLPGGGGHTVQPVFADDFADAVVAAVSAPGGLPATVDIVGPEPIRYADMVRECARALGRTARIVPAPLWALSGLAKFSSAVGIRLPFSPEEFARGTEDKRFDPGSMIATLSVIPRPFAQGVRDKLERGWL